MLYNNLDVNAQGHLTFNGHDTVELAKQYGTGLYLLDEDRLRENCRTYTRAIRECMPAGSAASFASKALSFTGIYKIMNEEGMNVDVVSSGEIYTALRGGFPAERMYFHGNNKTDFDIDFAMDNGVGYFIVDNYTELENVGRAAAKRGMKQKILLRIAPGIDPHTFEAVNTGKLDCQFGIPVTVGMEFVKAALEQEGVELMGLHWHIGSQIFDCTPFIDAADMMFEFMRGIRKNFGYVPKIINIGGGFGVRYVESDRTVDIDDCIRKTARHIDKLSAEMGIKTPIILLEPGRSIVADAGITLYTVGTVKASDGCSNYVVIDGGMSDNPRYALYGAVYTVLSANRAAETPDYLCTITGRCCEAGALIQKDVMLPKPVRGDIIAVLTTGAYNYSMASNYNRLCRLPIVMVTKDSSYVAVRRETFEDLVRCDTPVQ